MLKLEKRSQTDNLKTGKGSVCWTFFLKYLFHIGLQYDFFCYSMMYPLMSRCPYFLTTLKKLTRTDQQSLSKPRLEEPVLRRLVDMHVTVEDDFDIVRLSQEDNQLSAEPHSDHAAKLLCVVEG